MVGGWTSFSGRFGHGGYYNAPVEQALPVTCLPGFEGFNRILPRSEAEVLATIGEGEDEHPLMVVWEFGNGRAMAFASDCSPRWAAHFQPWGHYKTFWQQALRWLGRKG